MGDGKYNKDPCGFARFKHMSIVSKDSQAMRDNGNDYQIVSIKRG